VVVDFSGCEGRSFLLHNDAGTPFTGFNQEGDEVPLPQIMCFDVEDTSVRDRSRIPDRFFDETRKERTPVPEIPLEDVVQTRTLTLEEEVDEFGRLLLLLDGLEWDDEITEDPELGTTEIWELVNLTEDAHPIHLHLVQFQILERTPFDVDEFIEDGELEEGEASGPLPNERGWKDTVTAFPDEVTRFAVHFGEFEGQFRDISGQFVWHCHILEHEDHEMMRPYTVED
jgi:spore coat protein A, manganese oxidase